MKKLKSKWKITIFLFFFKLRADLTIFTESTKTLNRTPLIRSQRFTRTRRHLSPSLFGQIEIHFSHSSREPMARTILLFIRPVIITHLANVFDWTRDQCVFFFDVIKLRSPFIARQTWLIASNCRRPHIRFVEKSFFYVYFFFKSSQEYTSVVHVQGVQSDVVYAR